MGVFGELNKQKTLRLKLIKTIKNYILIDWFEDLKFTKVVH
jgi:hypothetical protein